MNSVHLAVGAATDIGTVRECNEDSHGFVRAGFGDVLVVCDGMGGHAAGDVASQIARDMVLHKLVHAGPQADIEEALTSAMQAAHDTVLRYASDSAEREGMGTTVVVAVVRGDQAVIGNVGDSRAYLATTTAMTQLSVDHTKVDELVRNGVITAKQAHEHSDRGVLSQAIGQRRGIRPSVSEAVTLPAGAVLLLCSDGVYEELPPDELETLVRAAGEPNAVAGGIVARAVVVDGKDNATAIVARYGPPMAATVAAAPSTSGVPSPSARPRVEKPPSRNRAPDTRGRGRDPRSRPAGLELVPKRRVGWLILIALAIGMALGLLLGRMLDSGKANPRGSGVEQERPPAKVLARSNSSNEGERSQAKVAQALPMEADRKRSDELVQQEPLPAPKPAPTKAVFALCGDKDPLPACLSASGPRLRCDEEASAPQKRFWDTDALLAACGDERECVAAGFKTSQEGVCRSCRETAVCKIGTTCDSSQGACRGNEATGRRGAAVPSRRTTAPDTKNEQAGHGGADQGAAGGTNPGSTGAPAASASNPATEGTAAANPVEGTQSTPAQQPAAAAANSTDQPNQPTMPNPDADGARE